ncbi:MAG TPA: hypothetical protein VJ941_04695 [Gracilimonas sp.]|nr:hypothetical protein [Gracilimonas sp.]
MRLTIFLSFTLHFLSLTALQAQVIDTSELDQLQSGEYKIAEGQLQVVFADTTTQSFVKSEFTSLGVELKNLEFDNVILSIGNHPSRDQIRLLQDEASVKAVMNESSYLSTDSQEQIQINGSEFRNIDPDNISEFEFKEAYQFVFVIMNDNVNAERAGILIDTYPDLKLNIFTKGRRAAVVVTSPDNEDEIISILESKPYVQSVAYMGVLE